MSDEINKPLFSRIQEYIADLILTGKLTPETRSSRNGSSARIWASAG